MSPREEASHLVSRTSNLSLKEEQELTRRKRDGEYRRWDISHTEDLGTFREQKKTSVRGLETSWMLHGMMLGRQTGTTH